MADRWLWWACSNSGRDRQVALVGRSGSGKSTLAMALFEMSDLLEGSIRVDGQSLSTMPLHTIRSRLALIPQEPLLFSGTVRSVTDGQSGHSWPFGCFFWWFAHPCLVLGGVQLPLPVLQWS